MSVWLHGEVEWQNGAAKGSSLGTRDNSGEAGLTAGFGSAEQLGHSLKGKRPLLTICHRVMICSMELAQG